MAVNKPTKFQKEYYAKWGIMPNTEKQEDTIKRLRRKHDVVPALLRKTISPKTGVVAIWMRDKTYRIAPSGTIMREYTRKRKK